MGSWWKLFFNIIESLRYFWHVYFFQQKLIYILFKISSSRMTFINYLTHFINKANMWNTSNLVIDLCCASFCPNLIMLYCIPFLFNYMLMNLMTGFIDTQLDYSNVFVPDVSVFYHHLVIQCRRALTRGTPCSPEIK